MENLILINEYSSSLKSNVIAFEKLGLHLDYHIVEVVNMQTGKEMVADAIDIDINGALYTENQPTYLKAVSEKNQISLSWVAVDGATSYNIKRSTTAGGTYDTIATGSAITFTDSDVTPGTLLRNQHHLVTLAIPQHLF